MCVIRSREKTKKGGMWGIKRAMFGKMSTKGAERERDAVLYRIER